MNCRNCGAPMELFDRRRYHFCSFCGSFEFIDAQAVDGIVVAERSDAPRACPLCAAPLVKARLDDQYPVDYCERCRGVLLPRAIFAEAIARRRARETGPPVAPLPIDQRELKRAVACPSCRARMDVHPYYGPGNVVIDSCPRCDLIWLDLGELQQITEAPGSDRGRPRETVATVESPRSDDRRPRTLLDLFDRLLDSD